MDDDRDELALQAHRWSGGRFVRITGQARTDRRFYCVINYWRQRRPLNGVNHL